VTLSIEVLTTLLYLLQSRRRLSHRARQLLLQSFFPRARHVIFFKSGRSALSAVFEALAREQRGVQVLVPDYICNVVPRAVSRAGLEAVSYRTTEGFEIDLDDLLEKVAKPSVAAVVLASLFGAQNTSQTVVDRIRRARNDVLLVLDDCQNLLLNRAVVPDARTVVVFSFNMKTITGSMGGGVCLGDNGFDLQPPEMNQLRDFRLECAIGMLFLKQVCLRAWRSIGKRLGRRVYKPPCLEYSHATGRIHYDMVPQRIAKLSLARAITRMRTAAETESLRKRNFEALSGFLQQTGAGEVVSTHCTASAPFVPVRLVKPALLTLMPWKGPYGLEGSPHKTLRPELLYFKNDGLDQFSTLVREGSD